jgi:DNA-binding CsgD family transcriptional regulator
MGRLSGADYRGTLDVLYEAGGVDGPYAFPDSVLEALRRLVPCDVVSYHEFPEPCVLYAGEPRGVMTREVAEAMTRYRHQDPITPVAGARKFSDFLSRREFHRLGLYQEVARPLGIEYTMRLWLDPRGAGGARLEFDAAASDFRERDRAVLDLLLPHLMQLRRNAAARRRRTRALPPHGSAEPLTAREGEILELVAEGRRNAEIAELLWISPGTVRKHLDNAYEKLGVHTRTGAVAALRRLGAPLA